MTITSDRVREIFKGLEYGDGAAFFEHVADNVDWTVMGTHPLAGHCHWAPWREIAGSLPDASILA
jgi:ketosteroid isomerase-like protein